MSVVGTILLAVLLLPDPGVPEAAVVAPSNATAQAADRKAPQTARITSRTSDLDVKAGVALFEGDVVIRSSEDFTLCADRVYVFFSGSNELSRVVADGAVSLTNAARVGVCETAVYRRRRGEVEMFGDSDGRLASLREGTGSRSVSGSRIRFWLDAEQVEVENSTMTSERKGGAKLL